MEIAEIIIKVVAFIIFIVVASVLVAQDSYEKTVEGKKVSEKLTNGRKVALIAVWGFFVAILTQLLLNLVG